MEVVSINVGEPIEINYQGRTILTGIYKKPVHCSVTASKSGLNGDGQADLENHGGFDKAIYAYSFENYRYWESVLRRPSLPFGQFGENLTVSGMLDNVIHIGDIFEVGTIRVQVTQPRVPCFKLGIKMDLPEFPKRFMRSGRVGFYMRVLDEGTLTANDPVHLLHADEQKLSIEDAMLAVIPGPRQYTMIKKAAGIQALSAAWRGDLEKRIRS